MTLLTEILTAGKLTWLKLYFFTPISLFIICFLLAYFFTGYSVINDMLMVGDFFKKHNIGLPSLLKSLPVITKMPKSEPTSAMSYSIIVRIKVYESKCQEIKQGKSQPQAKLNQDTLDPRQTKQRNPILLKIEINENYDMHLKIKILKTLTYKKLL